MKDKYRPKVGFIAHSARLAGAELVWFALLKNLPTEKIYPIAIFPLDYGPVKQWVQESLNLPIIELSYSPLISGLGENGVQLEIDSQIRRFEKLFCELELDLVVINTTVVFPAAIAAARTGVKFIVHSHGDVFSRFLPMDFEIWRKINLFQLNVADRVFVPSNWIASHYSNLYCVSQKKIIVLPNGVVLPTNVVKQTKQNLHQKAEIVMLCSLEAIKGIPTFLSAVKIVLDQNPGAANFVIYGDGLAEYKQYLQDLINDFCISDAVFIKNKKSNVEQIYLNCSFVVVASLQESFSLITIEAMSYSKPVIATCCGGPEDIVIEGETGYLIPVMDSNVLADRMTRLLANPGLRATMGNAGRRRIEDFYNITHMANNYLNNLIDIIDKPRDIEVLKYNQLLLSQIETTIKLLTKLNTQLYSLKFESANLKQDCSSLHQALSTMKMELDSERHQINQLEKNQKIKYLYRRIKNYFSLFSFKDSLRLFNSSSLYDANYYISHPFKCSLRKRLVQSENLKIISYREYLIPCKKDRLNKISLFICPLSPSLQGIVGVEIISSDHQVVTQVCLPMRAVNLGGPTDFILSTPIPLLNSKKCSFRVFVKDVDVPVVVYELIKFSILRRKMIYLPFVSFSDLLT